MRNWLIAIGAIVLFLVVVNDVRAIYNLKLLELSQETAACAINYKLNKCSDPVPLTEHSCKNWEFCMNRDPSQAAYQQFLCTESLLRMISNLLNNLSTKSVLFLIIVPIIYLRVY